MTPEDLVEIEMIKRVKYRYLRCLDQKLWEEIGDLLHARGHRPLRRRAVRVRRARRHHGISAHVDGGDHHADQSPLPPSGDRSDRPTLATGVWALEDVVVLTDIGINVQGAAFYTDRYEKSDDGTWLIAHTGYQRTYEELFPVRPSPDSS